ncbi:MAG: hypothetical protein ACI9FN_002974 [Saprospiraceae bacterium]|jgi:hypothetical protein
MNLMGRKDIHLAKGSRLKSGTYHEVIAMKNLSN